MTKKERNTFYKELIIRVCEDPSVNLGLCWYIYNISDYYAYDDKVFEEFFPELYSKKPITDRFDKYWFCCDRQGWKKRITLIEQCIKETN